MLTFLQVLGSLGVFLYGMKVLSDAIQKVAGQRMRHLMATMTGNRYSGLMTGFFMTCLLQSSSATTVIVVSFVNAGLLTLIESLGVIMGANLGTTITAWIIAAVGKFSLSKVAIPIIGLALPVFFMGKERARNIGETAIGFGLLFLGLSLLKDAVPDADAVHAQSAQIHDFIGSISGHGYFSFLAFLAAGVVLTIAVQSSSASMAITVTFAMNGWIGFEESAFIVLGENIGTTVTAWLATIGANHHAKRAARGHFLFNVIGVLWMLAAFPLFAQFVEWLAASIPASLRTDTVEGDIGFKLAIFHTAFNFINICLLIGFVSLIAHIVCRWVPDPAEASHPFKRLNRIREALIHSGELNLPEAEKATTDLAELTQHMFDGFLEVFNQPHKDFAARVAELRDLETKADEMTDAITEYLVRCSTGDIGQENAAEISQMIRIAAELETITDTVFRLTKFAQRRYRKNPDLKPEGMNEVLELARLVGEFIELYRSRMFQPVTARTLQIAEKLNVEIVAGRKRLNRQSMKRLAQPHSELRSEILNMEIHNHLEKIGHFSLNIMLALHQITNPDDLTVQSAGDPDPALIENFS